MAENRKMSGLAHQTLAGLLCMLASHGYAHTVWLEPVAADGQTFEVLFGDHNGKALALEPQKLKSVDAVTASGVTNVLDHAGSLGAMQVRVPQNTAMVLAHYDNGIWSRTLLGRSTNSPMNEVNLAISATWALKYHKTVLDWMDLIAEPMGQAFEVVPLNAAQPRAGEPMLVKVLLNGEPAAGVKLGHSEDHADTETNAQGIAAFEPQGGFNRLWAGKRLAVDEPTHSQLSYEYLMIFEARGQP